MIEKYSEEEIRQLIRELRDYGFEVKKNTKVSVLGEEASGVLGGHPFIHGKLAGAIYTIADFATNNYEKRPSRNGGIPRTFACKNVSDDRDQEYRRVIRGILETIKPHYGVVGFRDHRD